MRLTPEQVVLLLQRKLDDSSVKVSLKIVTVGIDTISRAKFDSLDAEMKSALLKNGFKIVDVD